MDLPEIPSEAFLAADRYLARRDQGPSHPAYVQGAIEAAWSHLYAAALRHAADRIDTEFPPVDGNPYNAGIRHTAILIRFMADDDE